MAKTTLLGIMPTNNQTVGYKVHVDTASHKGGMLEPILCIFTICWMVREPISQKLQLQSLKSLKLKSQEIDQ